MKSHKSLYISALIALLFIFSDGRTQQPVSAADRQARFAGTFYPATKQALESQLQQLFKVAEAGTSKGRVQTLIVPHAGYAYSGMVAASGYKSIPPDASYENIFIIASSHREQFRGCSIYPSGNYITPLGKVRVNQEIADTLIQSHKNISYKPEAHDREHSIEVQIPYLQYHFGQMPPIVPIVMGSSSLAEARELATALIPYFTPENLFIISSDFSHYPDYEDARRIDRITGDAILTKDPELFYNALRQSSEASVKNLLTPCCGWSSVMTMLYMADRREDLELKAVLYKNSGDSDAGDRERVVGYWAIAGTIVSPEEHPFSLSTRDKQLLIDISRSTLESYIQNEKVYEVNQKDLSFNLKQPCGAFVSLYMGGRLRGCTGNFSPEKPLYAVVQEMTIAAATRDPRFAAVESPDLPYISIEISVLTPLQKINSIDEFQPGRHGIYMTRDGRSGTYLPQVAEQTGWNREELLGHCSREKAGLGRDGWKEADLYVYEAIIIGEEKKK
ncbi:MAG: AmmeMemoRadiSam system protein B [Bacteroidales bacterium]|nr:AmmeMemoRadiSam system protein B [Bacteroidales bacterium]